MSLAKKPKKPSKSLKHTHVHEPVTKHIKNVEKMPLQHHEKLHGVKHIANKPKEPIHHHLHLAGIKKIKSAHPHMPKSYFATPPPKLAKAHLPRKPKKV